MKATTRLLDKIAADYHVNSAIPDIHIENLCQEYFIKWLVGQIPSKGRVLELGYGDGLVTTALAKTGCALTVVEGAKRLVDEARANCPAVECVHSLFEDFRPKDLYDLIVASHVLEHVDDPPEILGLMATWLRPTGKIIIVVPNRNSLHRQLAVAMGLQPALDTLSNRDHLVGHQRVYSLDTLKRDVVSAGFNVIDSRGFFLKVLPNSMMLDYSKELLWGLNAISENLPQDILANIAVIVEKDSFAVDKPLR